MSGNSLHFFSQRNSEKLSESSCTFLVFVMFTPKRSFILLYIHSLAQTDLLILAVASAFTVVPAAAASSPNGYLMELSM